jgi:fibronectin-binding autotransporter adhesin
VTAALGLATGNAATFYWDGGTTNIAGDGDSASAGGTGTWDTTILNWDTGLSPHVAWSNVGNNDAVFAGAAGTVTLGTNISAGNLSISNGAYTIATASGAGLTLTGGVTTSGTFFHQINGPEGSYFPARNRSTTWAA